MKKFLILMILTAGTLQAYQPGKWSPLDTYVLNPKSRGPISLQVKDEKGEIRKSAKFEYDSSNRLVKEVYLDQSGRIEGETVYRYLDNLLKEEELFDKTGKGMQKKLFHYKNNDLTHIEVVDGSGKIQSKQSFLTKQSRILSGQEESNGVIDKFILKYDSDRPIAFQFLGPDGKQTGAIQYRYDESGKLIERIREWNGERNICKYQYNQKGDIQSYTYYNEISGKLVMDKTLVFQYDS